MKEKLPDGNSSLEQLQKFADVGLIITDLDGTVINGSESVIQQIKNSIFYLRTRYGVNVTVATGRTYSGALPAMKDLNLKDGIPIAIYNGGIVMGYGTNYIFDNRIIQQNIIDQLQEYLKDTASTIYVYTFEISKYPFMIEEKNYTYESVYGIGYRTKEFDSNGMKIMWIESSSKIKGVITAILIEQKYVDLQIEEAIINYLNGTHKVAITNSGNGYIEIRGNGLNKGSIFHFLRTHKEYKGKKILAIGDNDNDIELFQNADISVAVANSSKIAIDVADYICDNESGKGFLDMLNTIIAAKRFC